MGLKARAGMHQTTVRFTEELWLQLEQEARRAGVSAAQYVRDATLTRIAHSAGRRGDPLFGEPAAVRSQNAGAVAADARDSSSAVWAQARIARDRAREVRGEAESAHARLRSKRVAGG